MALKPRYLPDETEDLGVDIIETPYGGEVFVFRASSCTPAEPDYTYASELPIPENN